MIVEVVVVAESYTAIVGVAEAEATKMPTNSPARGVTFALADRFFGEPALLTGDAISDSPLRARRGFPQVIQRRRVHRVVRTYRYPARFVLLRLLRHVFGHHLAAIRKRIPRMTRPVVQWL